MDPLRYSRQIRMPEVGEEGQRRLAAASVLIVGVGGLGSPAALYLAAAGVGRIGLIDPDTVELSNLHRQILYGTKDLGTEKVVVAEKGLCDRNPELVVEARAERFAAQNALGLVSEYDVVLDGTDNFATRYLTNDACALAGKPNVYGSVFRFEGQVSVFHAARGPCYRCLFPEPPPMGTVPSCAEAGVLGVLPGIVGTLQATEALKLILGVGEPLIGRLLLLDALTMRFRQVGIERSEACPMCGPKPTITGVQDTEATCDLPQMDAVALRDRIVGENPPMLLDVREDYELDLAALPNAVHIRLGDLTKRFCELPRDREIVVLCHHGLRSASAVRYLLEQGFARVYNLAGGIDAYAMQADTCIPRY